MIKIAFLIFMIILLMPYVAYTIIKWGVTGYYKARQEWKNDKDRNNNN